MTTQPLLPVREIPRELEYEPTPDAIPWLVGDWPAASATFDISAHEVVAWHATLAGQGRPWTVIRRIFKVAPMWGDENTEADLRPWNWAELSKLFGVPESHLKNDLDAAVDFWKRARVAASISRRAASSSDPQSTIHDPQSMAQPGVKQLDGQQLDGLPQFQIHQAFTDDQITAILTPFRFHNLRDASDRLYVANRILELRSLLEDKQSRESARTLIVMELNMASHESALRGYKRRLEHLEGSREINKDQATEMLKLGEALTATEKALTSLSTTYRAAAAELGSDEAEAGEQRRVAIGTISHLTESHRLFYESGSRILIDGMFTADEVLWLTTPLTIRPAQYRPDVVLRMNEAMIPANLWGKDYHPTVIQRDACRRLAKLVQGLTEEIPPPVIPEIDADTSDPSDDDADAVSYEPVPDTPGVVVPDFVIPEPRVEEPCMVIG